MKILYLDLGMGAAGEMLAGALLGLLPEGERGAVLEELNALLPEGVTASAEPAQQCGITGLHFRVKVHGAEEEPAEDGAHHHHPHDHDHGDEHHRDHGEEHHHEHGDEYHHDHGDAHHHDHAGMAEIEHIAAHMDAAPDVAADVLAVYRAIAAAEAEVHGMPVTQVHFHELGALDAVADVTAAALLLRRLAPEKIVASPVAVGSGTVRCAHGVLPVPTPATALLLRGVPAYAGEVRGELCTPTGAALIGHYASGFGPMPCMAAEAVSCGFGTKAFPERPNCVRATLGTAFDGGGLGATEEIVELRCNIDDMTAEDIGFAMERVFDAGAVDCFTLAAGMKKNRPGVLLTALCRPADRAAVLEAIFAHTTTIGVREQVMARYALQRESETVQTAFGPVRRKLCRGFGTEKRKWEHDDLERIARAEGMTLDAVRRVLESDGRAD